MNRIPRSLVGLLLFALVVAAAVALPSCGSSALPPPPPPCPAQTAAPTNHARLPALRDICNFRPT